MSNASQAVDEVIRLAKDGSGLTLSGAFGSVQLSAAILREACRCAACERDRRDGNPGAAAPGIAVSRIDAMGGRAFNLVFSDGHARGVFPWDYLQQLGARVDRSSPAERP